jgi:hypothetical protein
MVVSKVEMLQESDDVGFGGLETLAAARWSAKGPMMLIQRYHLIMS